MRAEELVARCGAQNIDLTALAKRGTHALPRKNTVSKTRFGQRWTNLVEGADRVLGGKQTPSMTEGEWTVQELAQAAAGVPPIAFMAACYAWAGHHGHYVALQDRLLAHALQMRREQQWAFRVLGKDGLPIHYLEDLCSLVLDQDQHQQLFALHESIPAIYLGVEDKIWKDKLQDRFIAVRSVYWEWLDHAARRIQSRLREDTE